MNRELRSHKASFRDPEAQVFSSQGKLYRALSPKALEDWKHLQRTRFFARYTNAGSLVATESVPEMELSAATLPGSWAGLLHHHRIPFVSYPYEWCFGMLKDAALLQLDLLDAALDEGMTLKDASPFNIQWRGSLPVFIDISSFEKRRQGDPWAGYYQFCRMYLFPLMLQSYKQLDFHAWLRGSMEGLEPADFLKLLSTRDLLRPGVLTHVYLHAKMQKRYNDTSRQVRKTLENLGFNETIIKANIKKLKALIARLSWGTGRSEWSHYADTTHYSPSDHSLKERFVATATAARRYELVWDLGANTGRFSEIAARQAGYVIAMDADHLTIERLYQKLRTKENSNILPLVVNLANPSPAIGWACQERQTLADRGRPDLVLCLALIHHLSISSNIPLKIFFDWLVGFRCDVIIEFVTKDDPMVGQLLANRRDVFAEYSRENFETLLDNYFKITSRQPLGSGTRYLYFAEAHAQT